MEKELGQVLWKKPNGKEILTNDRKETVEYCKTLKWKVLKEFPIDSPTIAEREDQEDTEELEEE